METRGIVGIMERKMETRAIHRENEKDYGNYRNYRDHGKEHGKLEGYIGIMDKKLDTIGIIDNMKSPACFA